MVSVHRAVKRFSAATLGLADGAEDWVAAAEESLIWGDVDGPAGGATAEPQAAASDAASTSQPKVRLCRKKIPRSCALTDAGELQLCG